MIICRPGIHPLLTYVFSAMTFMGAGYAQSPGTPEDWGPSPVSATLCPDPSNNSGDILLLEVQNDSTSPIHVNTISLLQVGRASEHWTIAHQPLSDALQGDWKLEPGEKKPWKFDLRTTTFQSDEGSESGTADEFVRKIPEDDRELIVMVLYKSSKWPEGFDQVVRYRPGKSLCPKTIQVKEGSQSL